MATVAREVASIPACPEASSAVFVVGIRERRVLLQEGKSSSDSQHYTVQHHDENHGDKYSEPEHVLFADRLQIIETQKIKKHGEDI